MAKKWSKQGIGKFYFTFFIVEYLETKWYNVFVCVMFNKNYVCYMYTF